MYEDFYKKAFMSDWFTVPDATATSSVECSTSTELQKIINDELERRLNADVYSELADLFNRVKTIENNLNVNDDLKDLTKMVKKNKEKIDKAKDELITYQESVIYELQVKIAELNKLLNNK